MSNLEYDRDDIPQVEAAGDWARANDLRPGWIPAGDIYVLGDKIHYREVVPRPHEVDAEFPVGVLDEHDPRNEFTRLLTPWMVKPLTVAPSEFGIEVAEHDLSADCWCGPTVEKVDPA